MQVFRANVRFVFCAILGAKCINEYSEFRGVIMKSLLLVVYVIAQFIMISCSTQKIGISDYSVKTKNGTVIQLGEKIADYSLELGVPEVNIVRNDEDPQWILKSYAYKSLYLEAFDGNQLIFRINILDDSIASSRGIYIGNSAKKVISKYGKNKSKIEGRLYYDLPTEDDMLDLQFKLKDDIVNKINIMRGD
jgi:hypothetical protein